MWRLSRVPGVPFWVGSKREGKRQVFIGLSKGCIMKQKERKKVTKSMLKS